jgi:hypothetical protein
MRKNWLERLEMGAFFLLLTGSVVSLAILCFRQFDEMWGVHLSVSVAVTMLALVLLSICVWLPRQRRGPG